LYGENVPQTSSDLWSLPMQGDRKPVPVANSPFNELNGQFSPDGKWIAYSADETGQMEIYVVPFPAGSGKWQVSTTGGMWPRWSRNGKELFFVGPDRQMKAVVIKASGVSFEASPPVMLFETLLNFVTGIVRPQYAVAADGRFLLIVPSVKEGAASASLTLLQNWMPTRTQ